jgi:hypothetical protein
VIKMEKAELRQAVRQISFPGDTDSEDSDMSRLSTVLLYAWAKQQMHIYLRIR